MTCECPTCKLGRIKKWIETYEYYLVIQEAWDELKSILNQEVSTP